MTGNGSCAERPRPRAFKIYPLYEQCIPGLPLPYDAPTWMIGYAALTEDEIRDGLRRLPGVCR